MINTSPSRLYDLEERTFRFTKDVRKYVKEIPKTIVVQDACEQLVRSSGSVGANYIEANEALGKKDFRMRIKICRKEAKESAYWLRIILDNVLTLHEEGKRLLKEAQELELIFGAILRNSK